MTQQETFNAFRAVADSAQMDFETTFSNEGFVELMRQLSSGLESVFVNTKSIDDDDARRKQASFQARLEAHLGDLRARDLIFDEKGVRTWIAGLCPGFWPFC